MNVTVQETGFESGAAAVALDYIKAGHRDAGLVECDLTDVAADVEVDFDGTTYTFCDGTSVVVEQPCVVRQRIVTPPPKERDRTKTYVMRVTEVLGVYLDTQASALGRVWVEFTAIDESDGQAYPVGAELRAASHPSFGKGDRITFRGDRVMLYAPLGAYDLQVARI